MADRLARGAALRNSRRPSVPLVDCDTGTFTLNGQVQAGSSSLGTVTLHGATVPFDAPGAPDEGWHLKNPTKAS